MRSQQAGFQLIELVVTLAVIAAVSLVVVPPLLSASAALRVDLAAQELVATLRQARALAIQHGAHVAVRFYPEPGRAGFAHFRDGDGDGVRNADITSGVDRQLTPLRYFRRRLHAGRQSLRPQCPAFPAAQAQPGPGRSSSGSSCGQAAPPSRRS